MIKVCLFVCCFFMNGVGNAFDYWIICVGHVTSRADSFRRKSCDWVFCLRALEEMLFKQFA